MYVCRVVQGRKYGYSYYAILKIKDVIIVSLCWIPEVDQRGELIFINPRLVVAV